MVSASTSVNAGVGPRLRRRVSPRICRTASSITQYSQTRRSSRSMDGPPPGSEALKNVPHRPFPRGRLVEVIHSPSLNPWETRGSGKICNLSDHFGDQHIDIGSDDATGNSGHQAGVDAIWLDV